VEKRGVHFYTVVLIPPGTLDGNLEGGEEGLGIRRFVGKFSLSTLRRRIFRERREPRATCRSTKQSAGRPRRRIIAFNGPREHTAVVFRATERFSKSAKRATRPPPLTTVNEDGVI